MFCKTQTRSLHQRSLMANRDIPDGITKTDLIQAIRDLEAGVEHAFGDSTGYDVVFEGKRYPPKAVVGLAARRLLGQRLGPYDFKGGLKSKCFRILQEQGFAIEPKSDTADARRNEKEWSDSELRAAIEAYLWMRSREFSQLPYNKSDVKNELREGLLVSRSKGSIEYRMQNISAVLMELGEPWIPGYKPASNVGENIKRRILMLLEASGAFTTPPEAPTEDPAELERRTRRIIKRGIHEKPAGNSNPTKSQARSDLYIRDPAVRAYVLVRANGRCELCKADAPFLTSDGSPYLEVHHVTPLSQGGPDVVENSAALCPNCHRRCHYAHDKDVLSNNLKKAILGSSVLQ